jgi:uncharacterized protein YrrD
MVMKQTVRELRGVEVVATDGRIGSVQDVYFDDARWVVRYLVVDTGVWLTGRKVLISPASLDTSVSEPDAVRARLTREQVERAPDIDAHRPVSRQYEMKHAAHFGYPYYWSASGSSLWGYAAYPRSQPATKASASPAQPDAERAAEERLEEGDSHLRSANEVIGYSIEARDGSIGAVQDFVMDENSWAISGIVIDTRTWWPGGHLRLRPEAVESIDWHGRTMRLRLTREEVKRAGA